jgi:hypothetical protein
MPRPLMCVILSALKEGILSYICMYINSYTVCRGCEFSISYGWDSSVSSIVYDSSFVFKKSFCCYFLRSLVDTILSSFVAMIRP